MPSSKPSDNFRDLYELLKGLAGQDGKVHDGPQVLARAWGRGDTLVRKGLVSLQNHGLVRLNSTKKGQPFTPIDVLDHEGPWPIKRPCRQGVHHWNNLNSIRALFSPSRIYRATPSDWETLASVKAELAEHIKNCEDCTNAKHLLTYSTA